MVSHDTVSVTLPVAQADVDWLESRGFRFYETTSRTRIRDHYTWVKHINGSGEGREIRYVSYIVSERFGNNWAVHTTSGLGLDLVVEYTERIESVYAAYSLAELRGWRRVK